MNPGLTSLTSKYRPSVLSGEDLFLFPDSTYIYAEWCDMRPLTIHGKGSWSVSNSIVRLTDDGEIQSRHYGAPPVFLALALTNTSLPRIFTNVPSDRIFLVADQIEFIESLRKGLAELDLVSFGLERRKTIQPSEVKKLKRKLMRESWSPDFFKTPKTE